ncbi:MAG: hypothetical protein ACUVRD_01390 [Bacteroidia bacterium]
MKLGLLGFLWAQYVWVYSVTETSLHRYHRDLLPTLAQTSISLGIQRHLLSSGESYRLSGYIEPRVGYILLRGIAPLSRLSVGGSLGFYGRISLAKEDALYVAFSLGLDGYHIASQGSFRGDTQLRPCVGVEVGSFGLALPLFLRYTFYPTPGYVSRYGIGIGYYWELF